MWKIVAFGRAPGFFREPRAAPAPCMKICRFKPEDGSIRIGLVTDDRTVQDLTPAGLTALHPLLEAADPLALLQTPIPSLSF